jgi:hypothetical protein
MQWRSRCYKTDAEDDSLIPASDLMNTGMQLNTNYHYNKTHFVVSVKGQVAAGAELYDAYCSSCDNKAMMSIWGVYLEDNNNKVQRAGLSCNEKLRNATQSALDHTNARSQREFYQNRWKAPRCKTETFQQSQGPLRCSLARLAWESCAQVWGYPYHVDDHKDKRALIQEEEKMAATASEYAEYVDGSAIHGIHPALAPRSRSIALHTYRDKNNYVNPKSTLLRRE